MVREEAVTTFIVFREKQTSKCSKVLKGERGMECCGSIEAVYLKEQGREAERLPRAYKDLVES